MENNIAHAPSVVFDDVTLVYNAKEGQLVALENYSMSIEPGEPVALIGPSGCGKSTTLHMIAGLLEPTSGTVSVAGAAVVEPRKTTALIPQDLGLFPWKTVYQNAALGLVLRHVSAPEVRERTCAALAEVGLADFERAYPKELSGGMRQRLALARAIALDMDLLLMDEPLSAIDALLRESLQDTLLDLWKRRGHTQVLVTHSIEEAVYLGKRIFVLSERPGRLVEVVENPAMGSDGFRDSSAFAEMCANVRRALSCGSANEGVLA